MPGTARIAARSDRYAHPIYSNGISPLSSGSSFIEINLPFCMRGFWRNLQYLGVCPRIRICRVPSAAWANARRCDAGDVGTSPRSANAADAHAPPDPASPMRAAHPNSRTGSQHRQFHEVLIPRRSCHNASVSGRAQICIILRRRRHRSNSLG
jgi:hypothetical protein